MGTWMIFALGFLLGIKHATEPDHVLAVSNMVSRTRKFMQALWVAVAWGIGHTFTLLVVALVFIVMKQEIQPQWASTFEMGVGVLLVYLGMISFFFPHTKHNKKTREGKAEARRHIYSMLLGSMHGLAGSASMIVLTMTTIKYQWQAGIYIFIFGIGTIIGMSLCTLLVALPFTTAGESHGRIHGLTRATGALSMLYGFYYIFVNAQHMI